MSLKLTVADVTQVDGVHEMKHTLYFLQTTGMRVMDERKETDKTVKETEQER